MPYIGKLNGDIVNPGDVSQGTVVTCVQCGGEMGVRKAHVNKHNKIPRHFFHKTDPEGCSGGESRTHELMKVIAHNKLEELFGDKGTVEYEKHIGDRFADVCLTLDPPAFPFGNGLVVEAQYKHKDKNTGQVQHEFFDHGYSVYWMYLSDIEENDDELTPDDTVEFKKHRLRSVWPEAVPKHGSWTPYQHEPFTRIAGLESPDSHPQSQSQSTAEHEPGDTINVDVSFPAEYYQHNVFDVYPPDTFTGENWVFVGKADLHSKGRDQAWFKLYTTNVGMHVLEFVTYTSSTQTQHSVYVPFMLSDYDELQAFVDAFESRVNEHGMYGYSDSFTPVQTNAFTPTRFGQGWFTFAETSNGLTLIVGRRDQNTNTRTVSVQFRKGDQYRLRENLLALIDHYKNELYYSLPIFKE